MDSETSEYSLSWGGHTQHIRKAINRLLQGNELCDVTLYAGGQRIGAHKVFLSACSKYFDQLFKDFKDERPVIVLKGVEFDILKHILYFVYNGETNVEVDQLNQFLETAAFLKIDGLAENHIKRKHSLPKRCDNASSASIGYEEMNASSGEAEIDKERQQFPDERISRQPFKMTNVCPKPPKVYKIDNSVNKNQGSVNYPDFSKAPEIGKYPKDTSPVGEWFSDYELNSQSSVTESHIDGQPLDENVDDPPAEENINKQSNFQITNIKPEITTLVLDSEDDDMPTFDQNEFANSLDAEIEIFNDEDDDSLEKQLMRTPLAGIDEDGLYLCKICGKSFEKKDSLKKHFAVHVNNTTCTFCGKVLSRKTHLNRHLKTHGIIVKKSVSSE